MRFNFAFLCAAAVIVAAGCNSANKATAGNSPKAIDPKTDIKHLDKLVIDDVKVGTGDPVQKGDEVWVKYTGKLANDKIFDSNMNKPGDALHVTVGAGSVIKGWDLGLVGMRKGGQRRLSIPYSLGYQDHGMGDKIPAYSDLYFQVELTDVLKAKDADLIIANDVKEGSGREVKKGDTITVDYEASANGSVVESTKDLKKQLVLKVGADQANIRGFDLALVGMKVGGERKVQVPPGLTMTLQNDKMRSNVVTYDVHLVSVK